MTLNRARIWGIVLTTIGVILAIIASIVITNQAREGGSLLVSGVIGFVVVAPFILSGIYQFWRGSAAEVEFSTEMPAQRELMDRLRARPNSLAELADTLQLAEEEVISIIESLHALDLFHGYRTPDGQIIYVETDTIRAITRCANCGGGIIGQSGQVITCASCQTEYYL